MTAPTPQGKYVSATLRDGIVYTAGITPRIEGVLWKTGFLGEDVTEEEAKRCVEIAISNALAAVRSVADDVPIGACLRLSVFLACAPGFTAHSRIADAASAALTDSLGDAGVVARSTIGVATLPSGAPVEVELTVALEGRTSDLTPTVARGY